METFIKYKAYYDEKANSKKLKESDYVHVLQALPNNIYLVGKVGMDQAQVLHRMGLRLFTPRQPIPDVQTTSQK